MKKEYEYIVFDLFGTITTANYLATIVPWYFNNKKPDRQLVDTVFVTEIRRLSRSYELFILSNAKYEYIIESLRSQDILDCFKGIAISSNIGYRKPSENAFKYIIQLGAEPSKSLLIDDREKNRKVAINLGFTVMRFNSKKQLLQQLKLL